jgi:glycosyltransferase involved in cell wall biosynthesis
VLAAQQLVEVIFPRIRAVCPKATLTVAGTRPRADVQRICRVEGVTLVSNAPSLTPLYGGTRVFAAMLPFGGGTKIKVIEAMAHGIPLVVNSVTAEGLALEDGANALIRDTPDSFAAGCVELLRDGSRARRMGAAARATWFSNYRPESVEASIKALLERVRRPD